MKYITELLSSTSFGFLLKLFSGLSAAGFGIFGIGAKTRDEAGKLTRDGRIALIGLLISGAIGGTATITDFVSGQTAAAAAQKKSDKLLLSVRRGLYPLRGAKVDMELVLGDTFPGVRDFKKPLRAMKATCLPTDEYYCRDSAVNYVRKRVYEIRQPSRLFPARTSPLNVGLRYEDVDVYLSERITSINKPPVSYKNLGVFAVSNRQVLPGDAVFTYDPSTDQLTLFQRLDLPDEYLNNAQTYSIADFTPGAIYTSPTPLINKLRPFCEDLSPKDIEGCGKRFSNTPVNAVIVRSLVFVFGYPKQIALSLGNDFICEKEERTWLAKLMPLDIDDEIFKGDASERAIACTDFQAVLRK